MRHLLTELLHLSNLLQMPNTGEWLTLSSLVTSNVVVRELASMIALSWSLSTFDGQPLCSSSSRLSSLLHNFLNHQCTLSSLAVSGPNVLLMLQVSLLFYNPF